MFLLQGSGAAHPRYKSVSVVSGLKSKATLWHEGLCNQLEHVIIITTQTYDSEFLDEVFLPFRAQLPSEL